MIEARVFNVGRGSAVLVRLGEADCGKFGIIDCFRGEDGRHPLLSYLKKSTVECIEFLIVTHPHQDHFLGISDVFGLFEKQIKLYFDSGINPNDIIVSAFSSTGNIDRKAASDLI